MDRIPPVYRYFYTDLLTFQRVSLLLVLVLFSFSGFCANTLPPQLIVTHTDETCSGAGSITCNLQNPDGTNIQFKIYLLPDTVNPISVLNPTNNTVNVATGTYQVIASEVVGGTTVTYPAQTVTVGNTAAPLTFDVTHTDAHCGDGTITITVTGGTGPFQYEILEGAETFPLQTANTFTNLSGGIYKVRVTDGCGAQLAQTHILPVHPVDLLIGSVYFPDAELPSCTTIKASNNITPLHPGDDMLYPLQLTYTVHPPGGVGPDTVITTTIAAGPADGVIAQTIIPFWYDQTYTYDLVIVDPCGEVWTKNNISINQDMMVIFETTPADCDGYFFGIRPKNFVSPYTITFTEMPAEFDPVDYNSGHPGPFYGEVQSYGNSTTPVPYGNYNVSLTDACGHTATVTRELVDVPIEAFDQLSPHPGCQSNISDLEIVWPGQVIVSVTLTIAPSTYPNVGNLPEDLSSGIVNPGHFFMINLTAGLYHFDLVNECGVTFPLDVTVDDLAATLQMIPSTRADCELGKGGLRIRGTQSSIVSITMTAAPTAFGQTMPLDVSSYLTMGGVFSMGAMPPGLYSFIILDSCGVTHIITDTQVVPYIVDQNTVTVTKHCNSFEVFLDHTSQNTVSETFWLQSSLDGGITWGHPATGTPYPEGTVPNLGNSVELDNHDDNINLDFLGTFRVVTSFVAYDDGNISPTAFKFCTEVLDTFDHDGHVEILDVVKLTCDGALSSVKVIADGVAPFTYSIIEKNGAPFYFDNGNNDTFTNLEPAIYTFSAQQACGDTDPYVVDIASLPSLVEAYPPQPYLYSCENPADDETGTFDLSSQDSFILGTQDASLFNITYHLSQADADSGDNPLPTSYTGQSGTLYGRIAFTGGSCYKTVSFDLMVHPIPELGFLTQIGLCPGEGKTLTATPGYDSYLWSNGDTGNSIYVDEPGTYSLTITKNNPLPSTVPFCTATYDIVVDPQPIPSISEIRISDWTDHDNSITIILDNPQNVGFEFSIDGNTWQSSNVFEGLYPGAYTVQVRDTSGCGEDFRTVNLLMYPKFFTPNGDGYNDYWKVKFSNLEPGLQTFIFDRYGKFLKQLGYDSEGWDGTYVGHQLPSTDYWFLVKRADGREFRGHFTMKR
ncbi:T9SS type B sorting domain-containing protein [Flavobacterium silvaticum]|uniref:T9SS type B sorting domain-containing protein n=1 Tax=Flavobacterium silvaticum TaxID=1852020 RepID=A0A972FWY5_9FLAO|nr:T9SS type B sorting domain-containing protein [Flavobacterium silvaticum]NMH29165.1 T9SS type B sorting domain-containing protein [Flavobacterium silvaticum]